nr:MAG TPA: hypothetical protein [Caudoviricetes sp.]
MVKYMMSGGQDLTGWQRTGQRICRSVRQDSNGW